MRFQLPLESDAQLAKACEPAMRALYNPTVFSQPLAALDAFSCDAAGYPSPLQIFTATLVVVPFVRMQFGRSAAWPAFKSFDRWQCIRALLEQHGVMTVCSTDQHNKGSATSIYDDVTLGAELATVRGVGACFLAPRGLGTDEPSMLARPQSIWSYSRRCSSIARCSRCQTPAACHSRRRLQHVIPLPWPSDWRRSSQGMPVSRT